MCLVPIRASLPPDGGRPELNPEGELKLPCGKCHVCISKRSIEWATRARHEISERTDNCFITTTYNDENLPTINVMETIKSDFSKLMKRLRKKLKIPKNPYNMKTEYNQWLKFHSKHGISYMASYEYGSNTFRPHMHAIIFGYNPSNQEYIRTTQSGSKLYTSPELEKLWDKGFHSIGEANEETAYYIASYALKGKERDIIHPVTGEEITIQDSMNASRRPAIGTNYIMNHYQQLVDSEKPLPRFYQKKLEKFYPEYFDTYKDRIYDNLKFRGDEETYAKLVIDSQKMDMYNTELRENISQNEEKRRDYMKQLLKSKRDNYVTKIKEI